MPKAAAVAGNAQVVNDLSIPFPLIRKPQVGGSIPLAGSIYQALTLPPLAQMVAVLNLC